MAKTDKPAEAAKDMKKAATKVQPSAVRATLPSGIKLRLRQVGRWTARLVARTSLPEIMLVATLAMARYLTNSDFSYPSEIIINIVLLGIVASVGYAIFRLVLRRHFPAHIASLLFTYSAFNYESGMPRLHSLAQKLIPDSATSFTNMALSLLVFAVIFGAIAFLVDYLLRKHTKTGSASLLKFMLVVIGFVFITQVGKTGLRIWDIRHFLAYRQPAIHLQQSTTVTTTSKPNIYYLLFDRYASATTLKNIYDYDNSHLLDYLSSQGFVNRQEAYANYPFTMMSVSSTLSMGYHAQLDTQFAGDAKDFQAAFPYRKLLDNPAVVQALKTKGYSYNQVSSWWDFTRKIPSADSEPTESYRLRAFGKTFWLSDLQRDIVNKSVLSPLLLKGLTIGHTSIVKYDLDRNPVENFDAQFAAVKNIASQSASEDAPQFTFAHILSPHDPYVFDENGNNPTYSHERDDNGVDETVKYINQLKYLNKHIEDLVGTIRAKDPKAIVVIQTDEGPYPKQFRGTLTDSHYYDPSNLPVTQMRQKFGVLASYYMPGVEDDTVKTGITSSVNAFRFVLNHYAGYDLPMLPDCQYSVGDKFHLFNYELVTGQLKGTTPPADCKSLK